MIAWLAPVGGHGPCCKGGHRPYVIGHGKRHPDELGARELSAFIFHLTTESMTTS